MKVEGIRCPKCSAEIWSRHRHDLRHCPCGYCHVDGGRDYLKFGWNNEERPEVVTIEVIQNMEIRHARLE